MLDVTAEERDFYGGHLILLEGVILEFLSCVAMIRRYQAGRGRTDPITSSHARIKSADSMRRKLRLRGFPATAENALRERSFSPLSTLPIPAGGQSFFQKQKEAAP